LVPVDQEVKELVQARENGRDCESELKNPVCLMGGRTRSRAGGGMCLINACVHDSQFVAQQ
jgi:hypothetical protein